MAKQALTANKSVQLKCELGSELLFASLSREICTRLLCVIMCSAGYLMSTYPKSSCPQWFCRAFAESTVEPCALAARGVWPGFARAESRMDPPTRERAPRAPARTGRLVHRAGPDRPQSAFCEAPCRSGRPAACRRRGGRPRARKLTVHPQRSVTPFFFKKLCEDLSSALCGI